MSEEKELSIVTEIGVFGELDLQDPTKKKIKDLEDADELIADAIKKNINISMHP